MDLFFMKPNCEDDITLSVRKSIVLSNINFSKTFEIQQSSEIGR